MAPFFFLKKAARAGAGIGGIFSVFYLKKKEREAEREMGKKKEKGKAPVGEVATDAGEAVTESIKKVQLTPPGEGAKDVSEDVAEGVAANAAAQSTTKIAAAGSEASSTLPSTLLLLMLILLAAILSDLVWKKYEMHALLLVLALAVSLLVYHGVYFVRLLAQWWRGRKQK